jgi:hypothetical protein
LNTGKNFSGSFKPEEVIFAIPFVIYCAGFITAYRSCRFSYYSISYIYSYKCTYDTLQELLYIGRNVNFLETAYIK